MPSFGLWEFVVVGILVVGIVGPLIYLSCGGLQKDLKKIRKLWHDAAPDDKEESG